MNEQSSEFIADNPYQSLRIGLRYCMLNLTLPLLLNGLLIP